MTSKLVLAQPQKNRRTLKRRTAAICLSAVLIGTPILITTNAQAFSIASTLKYIQQAQKILALIKSGKNGIGSLDIGNLGNVLGLFKELNLKELDGVLKDIQNIQSQIDLDPETKKLIGEYATTLGQLGVPIPGQVNKLVKTITANHPTKVTNPYGLNHNQALLSALNISTDSATNSVLGEDGQQSLKSILDDSQAAWEKAKDTIQTNGGAIIEDSVSTATDAQLAISSQDVLKSIAIQNTQNAVLAQQIGAAGAEQGKINAMGVNLQAKGLVIDAQSLEVQKFQANQIAAGENARQADTQGAFNSTMTNAYMFSCLTPTNCKK